MATKEIVTDPRILAECQEMIWRTDTRQAARDAGLSGADVERATFWAWRLRQAGVDPAAANPARRVCLVPADVPREGARRRGDHDG
jgi:hypothetical protein